MLFHAALFISAFAGVAVAQTGCQAQNILDACTAQLKPILSSCAVQDWSCLCDKSTQLLTCYNNCPSDPGRSGVSSENIQYCDAAKAYGSSSSSSGSMSMTGSSSMGSTAAPVTASASPTLPAGVVASSSSTGGSASATGSAINGSGTGAGSQVVPGLGASIGGLVAVVAGAVALL